MENIRNFVIIAHIDHGKSTLADRFLEITGTVEKRQMKPQYLDQLELERERGITIKMAPVRMSYTLNAKPYTLNLIDTPGHSDFAYEVSRALAAVEGAILLVDASQGIQAQTLANFNSAKKSGLTIIGAVNKIDLNPPQLDSVVKDLARLIDAAPEEIFRISGKTGEGVEDLLKAVVQKISPPQSLEQPVLGKHKSALIFDSLYDDHKGIVAFVRVFSGEYEIGDDAKLMAIGENFRIKELGYFSPRPTPVQKLLTGEIGYIATGIKDLNKLKIGDTVGPSFGGKILPGYKEPKPIVFVSLYPHEDVEHDDLKTGLNRLKLNDASFTFEPDVNEVLGRGFKCGFLGRLHFEIVVQRLEREFKLKTVSSFPSVAFRVKQKNADLITIRNPRDFPDDYEEALQPMVRIAIVSPPQYFGEILKLQQYFRLSRLTTENFGDYLVINGLMPLADLISDFDDKLKSVSHGYASFSYELAGEEPAELTKLEILVAGEIIPGLTRIVPKEDAEHAGRVMIEKLKEFLPRQQFTQSVQAKINGRIIAREDIAALRKDVTGYLYGGDRTRKMKLWKKQQRGKSRLKKTGRVHLTAEIFRELLKS